MRGLEGVNLFEIVPLAVSLLAGLGSLIVAIKVFGTGKGESRDVEDEVTAATFYRDRLEKWRARGVISIEEETWILLTSTGDAHPEAYAHVYRAIRPHVREIKMIRARKASPISISLSVAEKDHEAQRTKETPNFYVGVPVPL